MPLLYVVVKGTEQSWGWSRQGSSSLHSHWEKAEKSTISLYKCFKTFESGHKRHPWRSDPDGTILGAVTLVFRLEKSCFF
jgi:hypothetical protein